MFGETPYVETPTWEEQGRRGKGLLSPREPPLDHPVPSPVTVLDSCLSYRPTPDTSFPGPVDVRDLRYLSEPYHEEGTCETGLNDSFGETDGGWTPGPPMSGPVDVLPLPVPSSYLPLQRYVHLLLRLYLVQLGVTFLVSVVSPSVFLYRRTKKKKEEEKLI